MSWRHQKPTGMRLFRVVLLTCLVAIVGGGAFLFLGWALVDFDPALGHELRYLATLLVVVCVVVVVAHYPWTPRWAAANGCEPDEPTSGK